MSLVRNFDLDALKRAFFRLYFWVVSYFFIFRYFKLW